jgi:hypothetical protein
MHREEWYSLVDGTTLFYLRLWNRQLVTDQIYKPVNFSMNKKILLHILVARKCISQMSLQAKNA